MTEPDHGPDRDGGAALEDAILGEAPSLTADEVADRAGVTIEQARRLWSALGFADREDAAAFTHADVDAISGLMEVVASGAIEFEQAVDLTRAMGQTMAKLADWEVSSLAGRIEELEAGKDATGSRLTTSLRLVDLVSGRFEELLIYVWRRHLAAAAARVEALGSTREDDEDLTSSDLSVGFADIVAFTALSNDLSRVRIAAMVEAFESRCADAVATRGGRVIKAIGDSVLYVNDDPVKALETAEEIISVIGRDPRMPDVRVGLASGAVVSRLGDVFGPPVNLAARLTTVARRNRIIIDRATADLLPSDVFETRRLPARPLRGFGLLEPVAVRRL